MTTIELIRSRLSGIRGFLNHEPEIRSNVAAASVATILAFAYCLIERDEQTTASIYIQLDARGCSMCFTRIEALLREFEGSDPTKHLWQQLPDGTFMPLGQGAPDLPDFW